LLIPKQLFSGSQSIEDVKIVWPLGVGQWLVMRYVHVSIVWPVGGGQWLVMRYVHVGIVWPVGGGQWLVMHYVHVSIVWHVGGGQWLVMRYVHVSIGIAARCVAFGGKQLHFWRMSGASFLLGNGWEVYVMCLWRVGLPRPRNIRTEHSLWCKTAKRQPSFEQQQPQNPENVHKCSILLAAIHVLAFHAHFPYWCFLSKSTCFSVNQPSRLLYW
jgi:hypothetical protein